jgi:hypothetical protein
MRGIALRRLRDVHRQVADALEVGVDLHGGDDRAQVAAIGWCSASSLKQRLSISMCSALIGSSPTSTRSMQRIAIDEP